MLDVARRGAVVTMMSEIIPATERGADTTTGTDTETTYLLESTTCKIHFITPAFPEAFGRDLCSCPNFVTSPLLGS